MVFNNQGVSGLEWGYGVFTSVAWCMALLLLLAGRVLRHRLMYLPALSCRLAAWLLALCNLAVIGVAVWRMLVLAGLMMEAGGPGVQIRTYDLLGLGAWLTLAAGLALWLTATWNLASLEPVDERGCRPTAVGPPKMVKHSPGLLTNGWRR